jgi:hypothetical protein
MREQMNRRYILRALLPLWAVKQLGAQTTGQMDIPFTTWANALFLQKPAAAVAVYKNGLRLKSGLDYTHVGVQITFRDGQAVSSTDVYVVDAL